MHRVTWKDRRACGKNPVSTYFTYVRVTERGTSFSDLQAVVQAWHPMHCVWSTTFAHLGDAVELGVVTSAIAPRIGLERTAQSRARRTAKHNKALDFS